MVAVAVVNLQEGGGGGGRRRRMRRKRMYTLSKTC
jgi:hypothetical protein